MIMVKDRHDSIAEHRIARCSIVNYNGHVLFDKTFKPTGRVVNYLTWVSGITPDICNKSPPFAAFKDQIFKILNNKIIVGHSLKNDFRALGYEKFELAKIRDLSFWPFLHKNHKTNSLKSLTQSHLNLNIQNSTGHCSIEDARAAMLIYKKYEKQWEDDIKFNRYADIQEQVLNELRKKQNVNELYFSKIFLQKFA
eukprot:TRINITY_DN11384_c0_g2_i1.p2 TRINITY_DN11384_c0_g2~~TRINITY_DN11384_c0_g2_i1.p2  ORF type:complete len:196 (-),score=15.32 TRINITY_DN11384_c0_g2_i1:122-709(-)